jgi:HEPN domain-containing protein
VSLPPRDGRDLARVLLDRAEDDITLVRRVVDDTEIADAIVGFHAQQAVEKALKAVLAAREIEYAKTHALGYPIGLVEANAIEVPVAVLDAGELSPWAVDFRYETDDEPALDRQATLALIDEIRAWARASVDG